MKAEARAFHHPPRLRRAVRRSVGEIVPFPAPAPLRLEGSLAVVVGLAPVIPIFPALALAAEHCATALGDDPLHDFE